MDDAVEHTSGSVATFRPDEPRAEIKTFIGRTRELAAARDALKDHRLVTLKGPSGVGKTFLAQQIAARSEDHFTDGVVTVELAEVEANEAALEGALAVRFGLLDNSSTVAAVRLMELLRDRDLLLVLDNAEHLVTATAERPAPLPKLIRALLTAAPGLKILVTSQFRLGIEGAESVLDVPPLPTSTENGELPEAVQLLRDRVAGLKPLEPADYDVAIALCQELDGVALAIEMVAGLRDAMTWQEIREGLKEPLALLVAEDAEHVHHRSLHAAMLLTYRLLDEELQRCWAVLSVFPGLFDVEAAAAVCAGAGVEVGHARRALTRLVHCSVLTQEEIQGRSWYRMYAPGRYFGVEADPELVARARRAHAEHFRVLAHQAAEQWYGPREVEWMCLLGIHMPSLRAAVHHLLERGERENALELALDLCNTRYFTFAGVLNEARRLMDTCLAAAGGTSALTVQTLALGAWTATIQGKQALAAELLQQARDHQAALGDVPSPVLLEYAEAAYVFISEPDPARARMSVAALHDLARRTDHPMIWLFAAIDAAFHSESGTAYEIANAHLADAKTHGAPWVMSWALWTVAIVEHHHGTQEQALKLLQEALRMQVEMGDTWGPAWSLWGIAVVTATAGNHLIATKLFAGAWARQRKTDVHVDGLMPWLRVQLRAVRACRDALGEHLYEVERAQADMSMSYDDVVELALGLTSPTSAARTVNLPGGLSPREYEAASLLAGDPTLSNKELAARMNVGQRAAEDYVSKARMKTGVATRRDFAPWLAAQGPSA
ncbi:hypothetical protein SUDANB95_07908 (plasmid) [Actinosynnema sp. ALI-1.44]